MAQITPAIPDGTQVFTVRYKTSVGGDIAVINAAIRAGGAFIDTYDRANLPPRLELVLDEPWNGCPSTMVLIQNIEEAEPEPPIKRKDRYDKSGFEQVDTSSGSIWVPIETKQRFQRMVALQDELTSQQEALYASVPVSTSVDTPDAGGPGIATRWGRHVIVLVFAAVSIVVVVKVFF